MSNIRQATLEDVDALVSKAGEFCSTYGSLELNEPHVKAVVEHIVCNGVALVACKGNDIVGFILGMYSHNLWNPDVKTLNELAWWVDQGHRDGFIGIKLLKKFEAVCKRNTTIVLSTLPSSNLRDSNLERLGYVLKEKQFVMEI